MSYVHLDDLEAMERSCWDAFVSPEQEVILGELLYFRERPDNLSFERAHDNSSTFPEGPECSE